MEGAEQGDGQTEGESGFPELSVLGKRIELLRIERGLSKQRLARQAGTSRQQLWRVMTGKSELTSSLRQRLAEVLAVDARLLMTVGFGEPESETGSFVPPFTFLPGSAAPAGAGAPPATLDAWLADPAHLRRTLATMPAGAEGREVKRLLLNAIEDEATRRGIRLSRAFFTLRGQVVNGEL